MASAAAMNKAKIAKRVIEVLEFFDEEHREATVMDIVRRYKRPQSSTSELLTSLVDLGLLYKDPYSRSYTLTPRAALLGSYFQPDIVRDGRLTTLIDRLQAQTGLGIAVFGMVGLNTQIFTWRSGTRRIPSGRSEGISGGMQERLTDSAAGWLLLSSVSQPRRDGMVRRLNSEGDEERKFVFADMSTRLDACHERGYAVGPLGYEANADLCAVLLPGQPENRPMALAFVYDAAERVDTSALVQCLQYAVQRCGEQTAHGGVAMVQPFPSAA
ncbi:MAG TPA: helix-turn-helix domain-containing protein [Sphingobium sp.]|uniref:helix-turn-helix domain-containing protein n=1 Tax=Sphingobium sp. TaxID=1912891 RepID=UPI002ED6788E